MRPYYEQDGVTIYHGDCREILPTLPVSDLLLTDPPYGIGIAANPVRQRFEAQDWDNAAPPPWLLGLMLAKAKNSIVWGGNYFPLEPRQGFLVWDKVQPENFSLAMCEQAWCSFKTTAKIFRYSVTSYAKQHPTQKPLPLMKWCISRAPQPVASLLDPFMGSGTSIEAAKALRLRAIGIELEERYCEIAAKRLSQGVMDFTAAEAN